MREVLVNRLGGVSLPKKSVVRLTDRPDMTLDVYRGRKTTTQQQQLYSERLQVCSNNGSWVLAAMRRGSCVQKKLLTNLLQNRTARLRCLKFNI